MIDKHLNNQYGMLTAIKFLYKNKSRFYYLYQCSCGKQCKKEKSEVIRYESLRKKPANCGCIRLKNKIDWSSKIGKKINSLTLIEYLGHKDNNQIFKYRCNCGTIKTSSYQNILRTDTCGCKNTEFKIGDIFLNYEVLQILKRKVLVNCKICNKNRILNKTQLKNKRNNNCVCNTGYNTKAPKDKQNELKSYRKYLNATKSRRFKEFNIKFDDFCKLVNSNCHYCGDSSINQKNGLNGLDRIDSTISYELSNVVPCCYKCNTMKLDRTVMEFYDHINKIIKHKQQIDNVIDKIQVELEKELRKVENGY